MWTVRIYRYLRWRKFRFFFFLKYVNGLCFNEWYVGAINASRKLVRLSPVSILSIETEEFVSKWKLKWICAAAASDMLIDSVGILFLLLLLLSLLFAMVYTGTSYTTIVPMLLGLSSTLMNVIIRHVEICLIMTLSLILRVRFFFSVHQFHLSLIFFMHFVL